MKEIIMAKMKKVRTSMYDKKTKKANPKKPTKADRIGEACEEAKMLCSGIGTQKRIAICNKLDEIVEISKGK